MTDRPKPRESYVVNGVLATAVLYWVLDRSSSGRALIDWLVVSAVSLAIVWNIVQLSRRLRVLGGAAVWHVQRTVLFWIIGLLNTVFRAPGATTDWKYVTGLGLLGLAAVDTVLLWRKERRSRSDGGHGVARTASKT
jgi:hypothetical protein